MTILALSPPTVKLTAFPTPEARYAWAAWIRRRYCRRWHAEFRRQRHQYERQHAECAAQLLRDRRRYLREVLAHTDPQWWLARQKWSVTTRDWLLPLCDVCGEGQMLPDQAAARLVYTGAVRCDGCLETWINCHEALLGGVS